MAYKDRRVKYRKSKVKAWSLYWYLKKVAGFHHVGRPEYIPRKKMYEIEYDW